MQPLLTIDDLHTSFFLDEGTVRAVEGVDLVVPRGRTVGVVGESGCGKSVTAFSVLRLIARPGRIVRGRIVLHRPDGPDVDLTALNPDGRAMRAIRGRDIAMIFQEPMTSLSPVHKVGAQVMEAVRLHSALSRSAARQRAVEVMARVGIPNPAQRFNQYPHEMSGGLRQRAMIAMALSCRPALLIADEPTTALDVTIQAQILALMRDLQAELGMSVMLITHDLGVVAETADRVAVMYLGRVVEEADVDETFARPLHPYTQALMRSIPGRVPPGGELATIAGAVPDPFTHIAGCPFHPRCPEAVAGTCTSGAPPPQVEVLPGHRVACVVRQEEVSR